MIRKTLRSVFTFMLVFMAVSCVHAAWGEVMVAPTLGIEQMINKFNEVSMAESKDEELKKIKLKYIDMKNRGEISLPEECVKPPSYFQGMDTESLAKECFSSGLFAAEMLAFAGKEEVAFIRLEIMHNGFAELFNRPDMWKGVLAVYEMLISNLDPQGEKNDVFSSALFLHALKQLYFFNPFKKQINGNEKIFLEVNLKALKRFRWFIENSHLSRFEPKIPFYVEPFTVVSVALMLQHKVNPKNYDDIISQLSSVRFTTEQNKDDIKYYLDMAIPAIEKGMRKNYS